MQHNSIPTTGWCVLATRGRLASPHSPDVRSQIKWDRFMRMCRVLEAGEQKMKRLRQKPDAQAEERVLVDFWG